jgi:PAS domain S-box-containing protein
VVEDSPSWRAFTGYSFEDWVGEGWANAVHPDDREFARNWSDSVAQQRPVDTQFWIWHATLQDWRLTRVRVVPLRDEAGTITGWVGMSIEVGALSAASSVPRESP